VTKKPVTVLDVLVNLRPNLGKCLLLDRLTPRRVGRAADELDNLGWIFGDLLRRQVKQVPPRVAGLLSPVLCYLLLFLLGFRGRGRKRIAEKHCAAPLLWVGLAAEDSSWQGIQPGSNAGRS
jgi:hypothetical protein